MNREIKNALFTSLVIVIAAIILYLLYLFKSIIPTIIFGSVIAYILLPIANFFAKLKIHRSLAALITILIFLFSIVLAGYFLFPIIIKELGELIGNLPNLQKNISSFFENLSKVINSSKNTSFLNTILLNFVSGLQTAITDLLKTIPEKIKNSISNFGSLIFSFLLAYFFIKDSPAMYRIVLRRFTPEVRKKVKIYLDRTNIEMRTYFSTLVLLSIITGISMGLGSFIVGVKFATIIGVMDAFLEMLPYVGPTVVFIVGGLFSLTQSLKTFLLFVLVFVIVEGALSNFVLPHVIGERLRVPPVIIILMIAIAGTIFGPLGLLIATPTFLIFRNMRLLF